MLGLGLEDGGGPFADPKRELPNLCAVACENALVIRSTA